MSWWAQTPQRAITQDYYFRRLDKATKEEKAGRGERGRGEREMAYEQRSTPAVCLLACAGNGDAVLQLVVGEGGLARLPVVLPGVGGGVEAVSGGGIAGTIVFVRRRGVGAVVGRDGVVHVDGRRKIEGAPGAGGVVLGRPVEWVGGIVIDAVVEVPDGEFGVRVDVHHATATAEGRYTGVVLISEPRAVR